MPRAPVLLALLAVPLAGALGACTASAGDVRPPEYDLYFPTGMTVSPDDRWLFLLNANSDLRYSHGTLQVVDLAAVDAIADAWAAGQTPDNCAPVAARPKVLGCPLVQGSSVSRVMVSDGSVGIGNFATAVGVEPIPGSSVLRVFATVRGDPSVTWADFDAETGTLTCSQSGGFARCDEAHRLARQRNDPALPTLPAEPFELYVDAVGGHVFVTHFTTGYVSLVSAPAQLDQAPVLQDTAVNLWAPNQAGRLGAAGIAGRPNDPSGLVYVTSRQEARMATVAVAEGPVDAKGRPTERLVRSASFYLQGIEVASLISDMRSLTFSPDGNLAYVIARTPPSLQVFDTSLQDDGTPRNVLVNEMSLCSQPANFAIGDFGDGPRAVIPCFVNGTVWVVDPTSMQLLAVEQAGRGPNGVAVAPSRGKIYVGNYAEDTISVIDASPGARLRYRTVVRFGEPRPVEVN